MIGLGGSVPFWYLFQRARLIPRALAALGIGGYATFATGAILEILGFEVGLILSLPGALFEVSVGIWLTATGFGSPVIESRHRGAELPAAVRA